MLLRNLLENVPIYDNIEIINSGAKDEVLFSLIRNYTKITADKIPNPLLDMEVDGIYGSKNAYKTIISVRQ